MFHADLALARRLERMEGRSCAEFAEARRRLRPHLSSTWIEEAGAYAIFDGVDSPVTQTFGLGIFEEATPAALERIEAFFDSFGAATSHEVSPFAGVATLELLRSRKYRIVELSNVMVRRVADELHSTMERIAVQEIASSETARWGEIAARGWSEEHPELRELLLEMGAIQAQQPNTHAFLASFDGEAGAAGVLHIHERTALLGGACTVPELRRRGLQSALVAERLRFAAAHGCDVAMVVVQIGSKSQRNAEREGFRVAYSRTKWTNR